MNSNRLWTIGAVVVILIILVLGWIVGVSPQLSAAQTASDQKSEVDAQNAAAQANLNALKGQYASIGVLEVQLAQVRLSIPATDAITSYLEELAADASSSGVTITSITVGSDAPYTTAVAPPVATSTPTPTPSPSASSTPAPAAAPVAPTGGLQSIALSINVSGKESSNIVAFTYAVQNGNRLFIDNTLTFTPQASGSKSVQATLTGSLFVLADSAALPTNTAIPTPAPPALQPGLPKPKPIPTSTATPTPTNTPNP